MAPKPSSAKVVGLDTAFDAGPVESAEGPLIWATVRIVYTLQGLSPDIAIRVPIAWNEQETQDQRRAQALRAARELIDHACRAVAPPEVETVEDIIDAITPSSLEGIAQELGLAAPTSRPKLRRRR
jgi:hypothetical protein